MNRPEKGATMWDVREHLYYTQDQSAPLKEFVVEKVFVKGYFKGRYLSIDVSDGKTPRRYSLSDIGKRLFFTVREAALYAKQLSDEEDLVGRRFGALPVRRTWEMFLKEESINDIPGTEGGEE